MNRSILRRPVRISEAVTAAFRRLGLEERIRQYEIWRVWPAVVGPQIAQHAQPHAIWQGRLTVHVSDPVWLHHLSMMRHRLIPALNDRLQGCAVREMVLRVGEVPTIPAPPPILPRTQPVPQTDKDEVAHVEALMAPVGDAPFRDALRCLLLRALSRNR